MITPSLPVVQLVDAQRVVLDKSFQKWPCHVSLFLDVPRKVLEMDMIEMDQFAVRTTSLYRTPNSKYLMLAVEPVVVNSEKAPVKKVKKKVVPAEDAYILKLRRLLQKELAIEDGEKEFRPHITIGQVPQNELDAKMAELGPLLPPTEFMVDEVCVLELQKDRYACVKKIPLRRLKEDANGKVGEETGQDELLLPEEKPRIPFAEGVVPIEEHQREPVDPKMKQIRKMEKEEKKAQKKALKGKK